MLRAEGIRLVESRPKSLRVLAIQPLERHRIVEVGRDVALLAQVSNLRPGQPGLKAPAPPGPSRSRRGPRTPARDLSRPPATTTNGREGDAHPSTWLGRSVVDDGEPANL